MKIYGEEYSRYILSLGYLIFTVLGPEREVQRTGECSRGAALTQHLG